MLEKRLDKPVQLQFPFMFDVNMQLYRDFVLDDFTKWRKLYQLGRLPIQDAFVMYANSLNHSHFGERYQNKFFAENDCIVPYDEYDKPVIRRVG